MLVRMPFRINLGFHFEASANECFSHQSCNFHQVLGDFDFDDPMTEAFSESSFLFKAANSERFSFEMEESTPVSICSTRLDPLHGNHENLENADVLHEMMWGKAPELFNSPPLDILVDCTPIASDIHPDVRLD